ncbi:MAG TPA: glycoside hydrolase family 31 protein [Kiritimatiellia bacterium]|nr:glycoside hydrolase family 31 protein [Kiritimatiellia bacterium]
MRLTVVLLTGVLCTASVSAQIATTAGGVVVFEAENFTAHIPRTGHEWVVTNDVSGYSGIGFVHVIPNTGANFNVTWTNTSPELQYPISFGNTGRHFVWVRGWSQNFNDDSVHVGINGVAAGASNLTWQFTTNTWAWSNSTISGVATITVSSAGTHTINLWMREDGTRVDRIAITTSQLFQARVGNSFHIPANPEPNLSSMRIPSSGIVSTTAVAVYSGNQFQGAGNAGNQLQTGSTVFHRKAGDAVWTGTNMVFSQEVGNNKYFSSVIPGNIYNAGDIVEYYLRIPYSDRLPTYLYGNDYASFTTELETTARTDPFSYTIRWPLQPTGDFLEVTNQTAQGDVLARLYIDSGHLSIIGSDYSGTPLAETLNFSPMEARVGGETYLVGQVLSSSPLSNGVELIQRLAGTSVTARMVFTGEGVLQYEVVDWGNLPVETTAVICESGPGEHVYGFGEKFNSFNQSGKNVRILTWDPPGDKGDLSYKVAPWFVSTRGYGFHLESSAESYFDMRATHSDRWVVSNWFPSLKFRVVYGPAMPDIIERYTEYTGRPALPPAWSFAPWMSSDIWRTGGEVRFLITKLRERNIPGSVIVFDSPWETAYNDFTWNMTQFGRAWTSNVPGESSQNWPGFATVNDMMTFLRTNGYKAICWMTPFINTNSYIEHTGDFGPGGVPGQNTGRAANYNEAASNNYFVLASAGGPPLVSPWWKGRGSPVDFTNPDARLWIQAQLSNLVAESGGVIGGFKTDDGETGTFSDTFIPTTAVYHDGRTGIEMRNGYSVEYHRTIWNVLGTNGILFSRSGFTGTQAYPAYWAGDNAPNFGTNNGLPTAIIAGQSSAMCGYSIWSHDIGGYQDGNHSSHPSNLFMRWTQFGAFSPLMQMHRQVGTGRQFPWSYGPQAESNYQFYAKLHTALFPYRYSYAKQSSETGMPIIRPLVLMNQNDPNTYGINHTYLFGNEFLVAIMITNMQVQRSVYLPSGNWYDFWSNEAFTGGQVINWTNANQALFPLFVRRGAIIPMISDETGTLLDASYMGHTNIPSMSNEMIFRIYPGESSSFTVYDGTYIEAQTNQTVVSVELTSATRPIRLVALANEPFSVERNGVRMNRHESLAQLDATGSGWWYDDAGTYVHIREENFSGTHRYDFGPDSVGDGISDSWRFYHFGDATTTNADSCASCDEDGDGMTNWEEFNSGTDPVASNSVLRIDGPSIQSVSNAANTVISWHGAPGFTYSLSWKDLMTDTQSWQIITAAFTGNGSTIFWLDDGSYTGTSPDQSPSGQRYYMIRTP